MATPRSFLTSSAKPVETILSDKKKGSKPKHSDTSPCLPILLIADTKSLLSGKVRAKNFVSFGLGINCKEASALTARAPLSARNRPVRSGP